MTAVPRLPSLAPRRSAQAEPAALPSPAQVAHAPTPPVPAQQVAIAPPPPPPATGTAAAPSYKPRDPAFYYPAVCKFAAALQANIVYDSDATAAERAARKCAAFLDSGVVPPGYKSPKFDRLLHAIKKKEVLEAATTGNVTGTVLPYAQSGISAYHNTKYSSAGLNPMTGEPERAVEQRALSVPLAPPVMTEREKATVAEELRAQEKELGAPLPSRDELERKNAAGLSVFADISEHVRLTALDAAAIHIGKVATVTGGAETGKDALDICVIELERAVRLHEEGGLLTRSIESLSDDEFLALGAGAYPYPLRMLAESTVDAMGNIVDALDAKIAEAVGGQRNGGSSPPEASPKE